MRKIFLNAATLSLALLATSAAFQSCKDYDDDINNLQVQIDENKDVLAELKSKIESGSVITGVQKNGNGITITLSNGNSYEITNGKDGVNGQDGQDGVNGQNGKDATVWTIGEDGYWYQDGKKTDFRAIGKDGAPGAPGTPGTPGGNGDKGDKGEDGADGADGIYYEPDATTGTWWKVDPNTDPATRTDTQIVWRASDDNALTAIVKDGILTIYNVKNADGKPTTVEISMNGDISSIFFRPELYFDGVEGFRYAYADGHYLKPVASAISGTGYAIPQKHDGKDNPSKYATNSSSAYAYKIASNDSISFDINPAGASVKDVKFSFTPLLGVEAISRAAGNGFALTEGRAAKCENGIATLPITSDNLKLLENNTATGIIPTTSVVAEVKDRNVSSDYFSVVLAQTEFEAITLNKTANVMTGVTDAQRVLFKTGKESVEGSAILPILYSDTEGYNLANDLMVTMTTTDIQGNKASTVSLTLEQLKNKWGFTAHFENLVYTIGQSATPENSYLNVTPEGVLTTQYIKQAGQAPVLTDGSDAARSALGKLPVVRVTILNGDNVVLAGFVKCQIVEKKPTTQPNTPHFFEIKSSALYPILCGDNGSETKTSWDEFSALFAKEGISKDEFVNDYTCDNTTYVKGGTDAAPTYTAETKYGTINYNKDGATTGASNTILSWDYTTLAAQNIRADKNGKVTLCAKFTKGSKELYVGITINVADYPEISLKELKQYYKAGENEVKMNVPTANSGESVTKFEFKVPNYYEGDNIAVDLKSELPYTAANAKNNDPKFKFDKAKTKAAGYTLSPDELIMMKGNLPIATIDATTGMLTYANNATSKVELNKGNVKAFVKIDVTYGSCNLKYKSIANDILTVDFIRPINVNAGDNMTVSYDGITTPEKPIGALFTISDTMESSNDLFTLKNGKYTQTANLFTHYDVQSVEFDLKDCQDGVVCSIEGTGVTMVGTTYKVTFNNASLSENGVIDELNNCKLVSVYQTGTLVNDKVSKINVTVNYSWGSITVPMEITFKAYK